MERHRENVPSDLASLERKIRELAKPRPLYSPNSVRAIHALRYDWTGWLSGGVSFPAATRSAILENAASWRADGLELGEFRVNGDQVQILFGASPRVSPVFCVARAKGRLQHALRAAGTPVTFSRKVSFRSLGENVRAAVEGYLAKQVRKEGFADPRFIQRMEEFTIQDGGVNLSLPSETNSGRYWYNLHLVLVVDGRRKIAEYALLARIRDAARRNAVEQGYGLQSLSVMPDHLHLALRSAVDQSPETVALAFLNNLAVDLGRNHVWEDAYYVGTFSEYDMRAVRRCSD